MISTMFCYMAMFGSSMTKASIDYPADQLDTSHDIDIDVPFSKYPYANIFLKVHLGKVIDAEALVDNAILIKSLTVDELKMVSMNDLYAKGLSMGDPNYIV